MVGNWTLDRYIADQYSETEWNETQQKLLGRKTELTAMLEHSDNLDSKGREVSDWLGKLERQLAGASVGRTRDVLLAQIREVNQVMRELQKYSHHVTLFTQAGTAASPAAALPGQRACRRRWSLSTCSTGRWLSSWPGLGK